MAREPTLARVHRFPGPRTTVVLALAVVLLLGADFGSLVRIGTRTHAASAGSLATATGATASTTTAPTPGTVPAAGQTRVTGRVTLLTADDAVASPLRLPLTITVAERGRGDVTIVGVTVSGQPEQIVWLAGQPLPLSGTGSIDLGPAAVTADAGGIVWHLDHGQRVLTPGHYTAGAPVAVGEGGLADARDSVSFDAEPGGGAGFISNGDAQVRLAAGPLNLNGPGRVHLSGALLLTTGSGPPRPATTITFGPGPFEVVLQPSATGYSIDARFQGNLTAA
ncbi:MAG TPA: hypothetical protein VNY84_00990 [Acidimicrobiales bacterium]|jgi:hypothetical protein|nr:hypothetical protein [Acidimicrobiales bacterium]